MSKYMILLIFIFSSGFFMKTSAEAQNKFPKLNSIKAPAVGPVYPPTKEKPYLRKLLLADIR